MFSKKTFAAVLLVFWFCLGVIALLAYQDGYYNKAQIDTLHNGIGVPFTGHIAMILDIPLSILMALAVARYYRDWKGLWVFWSFMVGMGLSYAMHFGLYAHDLAPDGTPKPTLIFHGGGITSAGVAHLLFMASAIAVILQVILASRVKVADAFAISAVLAAHVSISTIQPAWHLGLRAAFNPIALGIIGVAWLGIAAGLAMMVYRARKYPELLLALCAFTGFDTAGTVAGLIEALRPGAVVVRVPAR